MRRRLPEPVQRLRPDADADAAEPLRRRGLHRAQGPVRAAPPPPQRRGVPRARVLHLRGLPRRRRRVPGVRRHRQHRDAEAGGRRVPGPDLPRDHRRVADRARRPLLLGLLLQAGAEPAVRLLPALAGVAVRPRPQVLRPRPHPTLLQLQLRAGGEGDRGGPAEQPGPGGDGRDGVVQDGAVVLDDAAGEQAVEPRRDHGAVGALAGRRRGGAGAGVRRDHQHRQRRAGVRARPRRPRGEPDRLLPALLWRVRHRHRRQPRLLQPEAVQQRLVGWVGGAVTTDDEKNKK
uniref:Uncharacterized protein n=1 Tax=Oryza glumipatula TaxID=40148 RepID=A0A0D9ZYW0_9ORYZ